jgi:putative MFS transporter
LVQVWDLSSGGALADIYGRRAAILLAAVFFVATSICGAMPSFSWNIVMCFLMGLAAGGMLPVANALLAEILPTKHRGWCLVLLGGIGTVGGYFATSACYALLQPFFGWRIMWFLGFPTGLLLIALSPFLPESTRFLLQMGRIEDAKRMLARCGSVMDIGSAKATHENLERQGITGNPQSSLWSGARPLLGLSVALTLAALAWGFVNFGVLLWLPGSLMASGRSVGTTSALIARSTLIAVPAIAMTTYLYTVWSTKRTLTLAIGITTVGLIATLLAKSSAFPWISSPLVSVSLLVVGTSAVISILLPYTSESFSVRLRGRATGWVAGCSKVGGVMAKVWHSWPSCPHLRWPLVSLPFRPRRHCCWSRFLAMKRADVIFANWKANSCGRLKSRIRCFSFSGLPRPYVRVLYLARQPDHVRRSASRDDVPCTYFVPFCVHAKMEHFR